MRAAFALMLLLVIPVIPASALKLGETRSILVLAPALHKCLDILKLEQVETLADGHIRGPSHLLAEYSEVVGWIRGYITAKNMFDDDSGGQLGKGRDMAQLMNWIFSYCQSHPQLELSGATLELTNSLAGGTH